MVGDEFDDEILETALARREALATLSDGPRHRRELETDLDVSKTTCHRIVRTFEENGLLRRTERGYELSRKGEQLEAYVDEFYRKTRAVFLLEPLVTAFTDADVAFDLEAFADARITQPDPDDPTLPLDREFELFRDAEHFRVVDCNQHVPALFLEQVFEISIEHGKRAEHIAPKAVIEKRLGEFPELHKQHPDVEATLTYRVCEEPTFGLTLYDRDHVVLRAYDDETGSIELMVDSDDRAAVAWAEDVVDHYRERSEPPSAVDDLPAWTPEADTSF